MLGSIMADTMMGGSDSCVLDLVEDEERVDSCVLRCLSQSDRELDGVLLSASDLWSISYESLLEGCILCSSKLIENGKLTRDCVCYSSVLDL